MNSSTGFFDLPRELRDMLYEFALEHDQVSSGDNGTMCLHVRAPEPGLRLISRQFSTEYDERSPPSSSICLSVDGFTPHVQFESTAGFPYAARATTVDIALTSAQCNNVGRDYFHPLCNWLVELVTDKPCIKTLRIRLCFTRPRALSHFDYFLRTVHRNVLAFNSDFESLQRKRSMRHITSLTDVDVTIIIPRPGSDDTNSTEIEAPNVGWWTPAGGFQYDIGCDEIRRMYSTPQ